FVFLFFFQAEDGIRDRNVTGVQTCALPIYRCSVFRIRLSICCCLLSAASLVLPSSLCSTPVTWWMPPLTPGIGLGETPLSVNAYRLKYVLSSSSLSISD